MVELLVDIGAEVEWTGAERGRVDADGGQKTELDEELCRRIRASFLLAGPLLARFGRASVPPPGGDVIGRRRLDPHIHALRASSAPRSRSTARYEMRATGLAASDVFLDEASVMATENVVMAAVLAEGETVIGNAACEPHVQDLCRFLVSLGAQIEGIGSNVLRIQGVDAARRRRVADRAGAHRGRQLHRPRRGHRRRRHDRGRRAATTWSRSCRRSRGSAFGSR